MFGEQLELWEGVDARAEPWGGQSPRDLTRGAELRRFSAPGGGVSAQIDAIQLVLFDPLEEKGPEGAPRDVVPCGTAFRRGRFLYYQE